MQRQLEERCPRVAQREAERRGTWANTKRETSEAHPLRDIHEIEQDGGRHTLQRLRAGETETTTRQRCSSRHNKGTRQRGGQGGGETGGRLGGTERHCEEDAGREMCGYERGSPPEKKEAKYEPRESE